ncbi:MAG TPA: cupredoxin domain-containing protein [Anaerolineales bacterium]|jgi:plastocyanin|nr:cupredoxin domain-containing protein [Anaerolineales bacterium]HUV91501.1 cupredoxin domain-containing protein [Anaerolineales bacterium]
MFRKMFFVIVLAFGLLILSACAPSGPEKISVTTTDFKFDPMTWTVSAGKEVELTIINDGTLEHEWVLVKKGMEITIPFDADDEDKVFWEMEAASGETKTETFTAPSEPGTYTIVCGTAGHLEQGMSGTLIIE